jgi:serine protease inhibitor
MSESENIFIISEGSLNGEVLKSMNKYATKIVCIEDKNAKVKKSNNEIFVLTDYFASRNNIKAWEVYRKLVDSGVEAENIVGTLFWQMKSMILAYDKGSATESGLNPFVFSKSKKFITYWTYDEIVNSLEDLTVSYHEAHRGNCNLEKHLELFILKNIKNERKDI